MTQALKKMTHLRALNLSWARLGFLSMGPLTIFLPEMIYLEELDLRFNKIRSRAGKMLIEALPKIKNLKVFNLKHNDIPKAQVRALKKIAKEQNVKLYIG